MTSREEERIRRERKLICDWNFEKQAMTWAIWSLFLLYSVQFANASGDVRITDVSEKDRDILKKSNLPECNFSVSNSSIEYFRSKLKVFESEFIRFRISFKNLTVVKNTSPGVFQPDLWVWTVRSPHGNYSYLSWNLEYGILSFSLLETKVYVIRYVDLVTNQSECSVQFGSDATTRSISKALMQIIDMIKEGVPKYERNYMCYLSEVPGIRTTVSYTAALYLSFPVTFINYKCCMYVYSFAKGRFRPFNCNRFVEKWKLLTHGPYFLGVIILLFFPIVLFGIGACISKGDQLLSRDIQLESLLPNETPKHDYWVYLDGNSPITVLNVLSQPLDCLRRNHPILNSRLRRLICVCFAPMLIYLQLYMFKDGYVHSYNEPLTTISVRDLVKIGKPLGFLALYGDMSDMRKTFVPILGGPIGVIILYFSLALVFIVCPKSLKEIVHKGLPQQSDVSPLFDGLGEMPRSGVCYRDLDTGYERASEICKQRVYFLFSPSQWRKVIRIQRKRFEIDSVHTSLMRTKINPLMFLFKLILCTIEVFIYVPYFLCPFFSFCAILLKGTVVKIMDTRNSFKRFGKIVSSPVVWLFGTVLILGAIVVFGYCVCLVFLESFIYLAQIAIYCFAALILFPTIAFGYLFFFVTLVYYLAHLVRDFGDGYSRLLEIAVNKSIELEQAVNVVIDKDKTLQVMNVNQHFETVRVNGEEIAVLTETQIKIQSRFQRKQMVRHNKFAPGIPRELFNNIVNEKRQVYAEMVNLLIHLTVIMTLISVTLTLVYTFNSEFNTDESEVLHIVFTVIVGFIPKLVEMFLKGGSDAGRKEIEEKEIGEIVENYWKNRD
ncbi:uncharacterized protein LOC128213223 [Mya arenaria]|uniref:uncharacterized protein LOC128213223 n=1 Tax=Mya arenaria TaxID=6604 RepID=UPI0022E68C7B|nr:uncharacterized protein LOC128213223 [Mya arenaria]